MTDRDRDADGSELDLIVQAVRRFIRKEIWLQERRVDPNAPHLPADVQAHLQQRASELGIDHLMAPVESGVGPGDDLSDRARLRIAEELSQHRAGVLQPAYGLFDPDPPPQLYASTPDQQERFLQPLLRRAVTCFRGLEDPDLAELPLDNVRIRARRHPQGWMLDGTRLFVADASDAAFGVVYANTELVAGERIGVSAIVVETDRVGFQRWRPWSTLAVGRDTMELNLSAVKVPQSNLLGTAGAGPSFANNRVLRRYLFDAAFLTGVMSAAQDMCRGVVWRRREHRSPLAQGERAQLALADNEIAVQAARSLYLSAAAQSDLTVAAVTFAIESAEAVLSRAMDLHGPAAGSTDLPLERWAREVRWRRLSAGGVDQQRLAIAQRLITTFKK